MKTKITQEFIDSTTEPGVYLDSDIPGFQFIITPTESKRFQVRVMQRFSRTAIRVGLGKCSGVSLDEARKAARKIVADIKAGKNPNNPKDIFSNQKTLMNYLKVGITKMPAGKLKVTKNDLKQVDAKQIDIAESGGAVELTISRKRKS